MAKWDELQKDFSGGEVGARVLMRDDAAFHAKSVLTMENFMPTLQGTAVRTPGTKFILETENPNVRIIPYLTPANERGLIELTPGKFRVYNNITNAIDSILDAGQISTLAETLVWRQQHPNPNFVFGLSDWDAVPTEYTSGGDTLGITYVGESNSVRMISRINYKSGDIPLCTLSSTVTIPEDETAIKMEVAGRYENNFSGPFAGKKIQFKLGTAPGLQNLWFEDWDADVGATYDRVISVTGDFTAGQVLHMTVTCEAIETNDDTISTPYFRMFRWFVYSRELVDLGDATLTGTTPFTGADLPDVHYVQSPYPDSAGINVGHEVVFAHPDHPPQELLFQPNVPAYIWRDKPFVNPPAEWGIGGYPATCTSFHGRLILAGAKDKPELGSPVDAAPSETVWGTKVGQWNNFSLEEDVDPDDSIEFTTIYRSPIQWVYGQKDLLVGAVEMEYIASADGIFQPGDLGVFMHSTHGSNNVQPVGMGQTVLFPAEYGTKVRSMKFQNEDKGWIAEDLTIFHPDLCRSGIRRMVRMRNPHQLAVVLLGSGQLAVLHLDTYAGVTGWSRINLNAPVKDICVVTNDDGIDQLFLVVSRTVNGQRKTYLECVTNWVSDRDWVYLASYSVFLSDTATNIITGLDHLEGETVEVVADNSYFGSYVVVNGTVTLVSQINNPINVVSAVVGLSMRSILKPLPLITRSPGSLKRYPKLTVRTLGSTRPIINGERPADRTPATLMNESESRDILADHDVLTLGSTEGVPVTIEENVPIKCEVTGIFGTIQGNSL